MPSGRIRIGSGLKRWKMVVKVNKRIIPMRATWSGGGWCNKNIPFFSYSCSPNDESLDCWRKVIDYYSNIILEAVNQRAIVANHIGEWKRQRNLPIVDLSRVGVVLDRIVQRNKGPLPESAIYRVFGAIVNEVSSGINKTWYSSSARLGVFCARYNFMISTIDNFRRTEQEVGHLCLLVTRRVSLDNFR